MFNFDVTLVAEDPMAELSKLLMLPVPSLLSIRLSMLKLYLASLPLRLVS